MRTSIFLLLCAGLAAQNLRVRPAPLCSIGGRVVDERTGKPLSGAGLNLQPSGSSWLSDSVPSASRTTTDASGEFVFGRLQAGAYTFSVESAGYLKTAYGVGPSAPNGVPLTVRSGERKRIEIRLIPEAVISGNAIGANGEPASNVTLSVGRAAYVQGNRRVVRLPGFYMPNSRGEFRIAGLPAGRYYIMAEPAGPEAATYYPSTRDPSTLEALDVEAGATISGVEVHAIPRPAFPVSGRYVDRSGEQLPNPACTLRFPDGTRFNNLVVGGRVKLGNLPAGRVSVIVWGISREGRVGTRHRVDVKGPTDSLDLAIEPVFPVKGRLTVEGGPLPRRARVRLEMQDSVPWLTKEADAGWDGGFQLAGVSADRYFVSVTGLPNGYYLKSVRMGNVDGIEDGVEFSGRPEAPLEIVVSARAATVRGSAVAGGAGVTVALVPQGVRKRRRPEFYRTAVTDDRGRFSITGVPPGDYKLFAWSSVEDGAWMAESFINPLEPQGKPVALREGSAEEIELKVIR